jgi:hypothetical protein
MAVVYRGYADYLTDNAPFHVLSDGIPAPGRFLFCIPI